MTISEILEAVMLICFGFSWPMSVIKNIKAGTAKGMSLVFILLIMTGYIAGITSKFIARNVSYVLIVYLINILFVAINLIVYFVNLHKDKKNGEIKIKKIIGEKI